MAEPEYSVERNDYAPINAWRWRGIKLHAETKIVETIRGWIKRKKQILICNRVENEYSEL